jgi:hypothetical protein
VHDQQGAELERLAQVVRLDPAGNDGARLRVVNVGRREIGNEPRRPDAGRPVTRFDGAICSILTQTRFDQSSPPHSICLTDDGRR